jgi:proteasome accessory factor A
VLQTPRGAISASASGPSTSGRRLSARPPRRAHHQHPGRATRRRRAYRRLHVIVGDSNMSETTTMLKVGSATWSSGMIEAGVVMRDLTLETRSGHPGDQPRHDGSQESQASQWS